MVFGGSTLQGGVVARGVVSTVTVVEKRIPTTSTVVLAGLWVCSVTRSSRGGWGDGAGEGGGALSLLMLLLVLILLRLLVVSVSRTFV